jgi:RimJ/RimL family protein N-acetyltransferase
MALMIGHWQLHGHGYWALEEKQSEQFVGCMGLWKSPGWPELELGYWLVGAHHGKGFGREAGQACVEYAGKTLNAESLVSYIDKDNIPSIKLAESIGAVYEQTIELDTHGPHGVYRHF